MAERIFTVQAREVHQSIDPLAPAVPIPRAIGDVYTAEEPDAVAAAQAGMCWLVSNPYDFVAHPYPAP